MKIINKIESILWVIIISFSVFVLTPAFAYLMSESSADNYAKVCVLFINSIYCFLAGIVITKKEGFKWYYSLIIALTFIPAVFMYFNISTIYFVVIYILIELVGSLMYLKYTRN